jgi:hypothetical protein
MSASSGLCDLPARAKAQRSAIAGIPPVAIAFLVLTTGISLLFSHFKLLWYDEFLVMWTDSAASIGQIAHIQRSCPISLDPLVYHATAHAAIRLFGAGAFAIRLPSLLGFLLMQVCLFFFVCRIAGERAAVLALVFPALTGAFYYSAEGRPYGLLLGLFGLAMISWQTAARRETKRTFALVALAVAIALGLNTHYFGVLLLVPLCAAELFRTLQLRRLDLPVLASIAAGAAGIAFTLPLIKAAGEFRPSYNASLNLGDSVWVLYGVYGELLSHFGTTHRHVWVFLLLFAAVVLWLCIRQVRRGAVVLLGAEAVFLSVLIALPVFGCLLAFLVGSPVEVRFVLGTVIGVSALAAVGLSSLVAHKRADNLLLALLLAGIGLNGIRLVLAEQGSEQKHNQVSSLTLSPEVNAALAASPSKQLYFQNAREFAFASYYEPDPENRSRLVLVYSKNLSRRYHVSEISSLTALHLHEFTDLTIIPFESVAREPGEHVFLVFHDPGKNWIDQAFAEDHANVRPIGSALGGDVVSVRFQP